MKGIQRPMSFSEKELLGIGIRNQILLEWLLIIKLIEPDIFILMI